MFPAGILPIVYAFAGGLLDAKPAPILTDVYIGSAGPYRFLVDTGAESSAVDPALAAILGLKPEYRVEQVTVHGSRYVPGLKVASMRIGATGQAVHTIRNVELLLQDVAEARRIDPSVQGILGLSALDGLNFTMTPSGRRLDCHAPRPSVGEVVPFVRVEGRLAVNARMGSERLTLILDSGSTNIVLFHVPEAMTKTAPVAAAVRTIEGARSIAPTRWTADLIFTNALRLGMLPAAIVERKGGSKEAHGLLPAAVFQKIHVDQARGELVIVR